MEWEDQKWLLQGLDKLAISIARAVAGNFGTTKGEDAVRTADIPRPPCPRQKTRTAAYCSHDSRRRFPKETPPPSPTGWLQPAPHLEVVLSSVWTKQRRTASGDYYPDDTVPGDLAHHSPIIPYLSHLDGRILSTFSGFRLGYHNRQLWGRCRPNTGLQMPWLQTDRLRCRGGCN